ncbi:hypothetical protein Sps_00049 [Shewanella psychrophila]|uniref:Uncharacterized protein n=1 Tax=Shewanella psychrophila TaxID=225848 RepID=A0A1S6HIE4_9GAMM|nr:hypothetical protein [Shewanella psychrophila]AQS35274.1 hypothetical protein Sps_00049 [Shewanella psychrophila]
MQIILLTILALFLLCMAIFRRLKWKLTTLYFATISSLSIIFITKKYFFPLEPEAVNAMNSVATFFTSMLVYRVACYLLKKIKNSRFNIVITVTLVILVTILSLYTLPRMVYFLAFNEYQNQETSTNNTNPLKLRKIEYRPQSSDVSTDISLSFMLSKSLIPLDILKVSSKRLDTDSIMYFYEHDNTYKSLNISKVVGNSNYLKQLLTEENSEELENLVGVKPLSSDFELLKYLFKFERDDLSFFSSLDDYKLALMSTILKSTFIAINGNILEFKLDKGYQGFQFGESELNTVVRVNVYSNKTIIKLTFNGFTQQEIDFFLSQIELIEQ